MPMTLTDAEVKAMAEALRSLEEAQSLVLDATRKLSVVPGFYTEYSEVSALHDKIKETWHNVNDKRAATK